MKKTIDQQTRYAFFDTNWPTLVTMGWEYEIDNPNVYNSTQWHSEVDKISKTLGQDFTYCIDGGHFDEDGEDTDTLGIEVRSPVGPLYLAKHWAKKLIPFTKCVKDFNNEYTNNGGIHVNISKNNFTNKQAPKVFQFLHNMKHYNLLLKLSTRERETFNEYAGIHKYRDCENDRNRFGIITAVKSYAYELRMFGAHHTVFLPSLEFADALFRYAATVDTIDPDLFFTWVHKNSSKYPELGAHIAKCL